MRAHLSERYPFSLWLRPASTQRSELLRIIERLGRRFDTPRFEPHSTLLSGYAEVAAIRNEIADRVGRACKELGPITMEADGLGQTEERFTFFFLRLKGPEFREACSRFNGVAASLQEPRVGPHVSLAYGEVSSKIDRAAASKEILAALPIQVVFDAVQVVTPRGGRWDDVQGWECGVPIELEG